MIINKNNLMSENEYIDNNYVKEINKLIAHGNKIITKENEVILFMGDTGSGKSTLVNYLSGNKLIAKKKERGGLENNKIVIDTINNNNVKINHTTVSETTVPNKWFDNNNNLVYWDCPGFGDTKGPIQDIANAFYIKKLFDSSNKLKLVIVVELGSLKNNKAKSFVNLVNTLSNLFVNVTDYKNGLFMVVTKTNPKVCVQGVKDQILLILGEQENFLNKNQKEILTFLAGNESHIELFEKPQEQGIISDNNKNDILTMLKKMESLLLADTKIKIAIADKSKLYVKELADDSQNKMIITIDKLCQHHINNYKQTDNITKKDFSVVVQIINELRKNHDSFVKIINIKDKKIEFFIEEIKQFSFLDNSYHKKIMQEIDNFIFYEHIDPNLNNSLYVSEWLFRFSQCGTELKSELDRIEGQIKSKIIGDAKNIIDSIVATVQQNMFEKLKKMSKENSIGFIRGCKTYSENIDNLVLQKDLDLDIFCFINSGLISDKSLDLILLHKNILITFDDDYKLKYRENIKSSVEPLRYLRQEYKNKIEDLKKNILNTIEQCFEHFSQNIINATNDKSLKKIKTLKNQFCELTKLINETDSFEDLIQMMLKHFTANMSLGKIRINLTQLGKLKMAGIEIETIDANKYIKILLSVEKTVCMYYENLSIKMSEEFENQINNKIESFIFIIKSFYDKLNGNETQKNLINVFDNFEIDTNLSQQIINIKKEIETNKFQIDIKDLDSISHIIKKSINIEQRNNIMFSSFWYIEVSNLALIFKEKERIEMVREKFIYNFEAFLKDIENYIRQIEINDNIKTITPELQNCNELVSIIFDGINQQESENFVNFVEIHVRKIFGINNKLDAVNIINMKNLKIKDLVLGETIQINKLKQLEVKIKNNLCWYGALPQIYEKISDKKFHYDSVDTNNFKKFLNDLKISEPENISCDANKINKLNNLLNFILHDSLKIEFGTNKIINISGNNIKCSDFYKKLTKNVKLINIRCLDTITFDVSVDLPGVNMIVISPKWIIQQNVIINLSGADAKNNSSDQAGNGYGYDSQMVSQNGCDGLSGSPGQNSGCFYGIGNEFYNLQNLDIKTDGGQGGNGQNGGNGANGKNGKDATIYDCYYEKKLSAVIKNWEKQEKINGKTYNRTGMRIGYPGSRGGNGGNGGLGGIGGFPGTVKIWQNNTVTKMSSGKKNDGTAGIVGNPGRGGKDGNDLEVYIYNIHHTQYTKSIINDRSGKSGKNKNFSNITNDNCLVDKTKHTTKFKKYIAKTKSEYKSKILSLQNENELFYKIRGSMLQKFCNNF